MWLFRLWRRLKWLDWFRRVFDRRIGRWGKRRRSAVGRPELHRIASHACVYSDRLHKLIHWRFAPSGRLWRHGRFGRWLRRHFGRRWRCFNRHLAHVFQTKGFVAFNNKPVLTKITIIRLFNLFNFKGGRLSQIQITTKKQIYIRQNKTYLRVQLQLLHLKQSLW